MPMGQTILDNGAETIGKRGPSAVGQKQSQVGGGDCGDATSTLRVESGSGS